MEAGEAVGAGGAADGVVSADGAAGAGLQEGREAEGEEEAVGCALWRGGLVGFWWRGAKGLWGWGRGCREGGRTLPLQVLYFWSVGSVRRALVLPNKIQGHQNASQPAEMWVRDVSFPSIQLDSTEHAVFSEGQVGYSRNSHVLKGLQARILCVHPPPIVAARKEEESSEGCYEWTRYRYPGDGAELEDGTREFC